MFKLLFYDLPVISHIPLVTVRNIWSHMNSKICFEPQNLTYLGCRDLAYYSAWCWTSSQGGFCFLFQFPCSDLTLTRVSRYSKMEPVSICRKWQRQWKVDGLTFEHGVFLCISHLCLGHEWLLLLSADRWLNIPELSLVENLLLFTPLAIKQLAAY